MDWSAQFRQPAAAAAQIWEQHQVAAPGTLPPVVPALHPARPAPALPKAGVLPSPTPASAIAGPKPHIAAPLLPWRSVLLERKSPCGHGLLPASDPAELAGQSRPRCPAGNHLLSILGDNPAWRCQWKGAAVKQPVCLLRSRRMSNNPPAEAATHISGRGSSPLRGWRCQRSEVSVASDENTSRPFSVI